MPIKRPPLVEGEIYHVYNRSIDGKVIFPSDEYYERFIQGLQTFNTTSPIQIRDMAGNDTEIKSQQSQFRGNRGERLVDVGVFNLRPTHYHLLLRQVVPNGISLFMQKSGVGFTSFFNLKNFRKGPVFQGTFRVKLADKDRYLKHLFAYIALNSLDADMSEWRGGGITDRKKAEDILVNAKWSSFGSLVIGDERFKNIINEDFAGEFFDNTDELKNFVLSWSEKENNLIKDVVAG